MDSRALDINNFDKVLPWWDTLYVKKIIAAIVLVIICIILYVLIITNKIPLNLSKNITTAITIIGGICISIFIGNIYLYASNSYTNHKQDFNEYENLKRDINIMKSKM